MSSSQTQLNQPHTTANAETSELHLTAFNFGSFALDGGAMFGRVPKPLWEKQYPADDRNRIPMAQQSLLVRWEAPEGGRRALLIDDGMGDKWSNKSRDIYNIRNNAEVWDKAGLRPEDITDVMLTHLHFDHCGGSTKHGEGPDKPLVPAFPNAKYYLSREQWDYAHAPSLLDRVSYVADNYEPLQSAGVLEFLKPPRSPWPHIRLLQFFGHTGGLTLPLINAGSKIVLYTGDLIPNHCHVRLAWIMGYDLSAEETLAEKSFVLELAAENGWGLFLQHDVHVEVVTVKRDGADFAIERHWTLKEFLAAP